MKLLDSIVQLVWIVNLPAHLKYADLDRNLGNIGVINAFSILH